MKRISLLIALLVSTPVFAQQRVVPVDSSNTPIPQATTTEAQQDVALTISTTKALLDMCRARDTAPTAVTAADRAVLGVCNLLGLRGVFLAANNWGGADTCYITSAASTNSTNCLTAGSTQAHTIYDIQAINTTSTTYFLRLYDASSAPTCSSATNFKESIPIPNNAGAGAGVVRTFPVGRNYVNGVSFCLTLNGSSTDNNNAATGVYISLGIK